MGSAPERSIVWRVARWAPPAKFVERYADELLLLHLDRARASRAGPLRFWTLLLADVALTAVQLRVDGRQHPNSAHRATSKGDAVRQVIRHALFALARSRGFSAAVILALALGIGATATLFTVSDRLLLNAPSHVERPAELRRVLVHGFSPFKREVGFGESFSYPDFVELSNVPEARVAGHSQREMTFGDVNQRCRRGGR